MVIDFVIAYVDNTDIVWRKKYIDYCTKNRLQEKIVELSGNRYGGINFINWQIKLVNKNMPWVNKIYLLLSNIEQKPKDLPNNVEIVLHEDFIPYAFLPTFNSTTIEMFLWNIKGLSEHFIYANDDMLPIKPLKPSDFFEEDKIKIGKAGKGRVKSEAECKKLSESKRGEKNPMFKDGHRSKFIEHPKKEKHYKWTEERRKNYIPWNKGLKNCISDETRKKMSESAKNRKSHKN